MIKRAYGYNHYLIQRIHNTKIKKCDLYFMLDNIDNLFYAVRDKKITEDARYILNCRYLDKEFGIKDK